MAWFIIIHSEKKPYIIMIGKEHWLSLGGIGRSSDKVFQSDGQRHDYSMDGRLK